LYAHGYVKPSEPVALTNDPEAMLGILLYNGYAVAHSSYSENGWAVKDGAIRVRQLRGYFAGAYGEPEKTYLVGASEGAIISIMLAEKNPSLFTGALCIGGPLGGAEMEVEYIYNLRILFDYFFRDELVALANVGDPLAEALLEALGASALDAHPTDSPLLDLGGMEFAADVGELILTLFQMSTPPLSEALCMATTMVNGVPLFNWPISTPPNLDFLPELAATIAGGLWYNIFATEDILSRTHGHVPVDNLEDEYSYLVPAMPEVVFDPERLTSRPDARKYFAHWYQPTGRLALPVVILHTLRDPIVPVGHAYKYQALAAASGNSALLEVDVIPFFGHCQILEPPDYTPNDELFAARVLFDLNLLLQGTGMPELQVPPVPLP
jgi:pimeloyl-ACP methyl ester carboxylesterase